MISAQRRRATSVVGSRLPSPGHLSLAPHLSPLHLLYKSFTLIKGPFVAFPNPHTQWKLLLAGSAPWMPFIFAWIVHVIFSFWNKFLSKLQLCRSFFKSHNHAKRCSRTWPENIIQSGERMMHMSILWNNVTKFRQQLDYASCADCACTKTKQINKFLLKKIWQNKR